MPLKSGSSQATISENIRELHHGPTHARTSKKFGEERAHEQSIAIAMETARKTRKRADGGKVHIGPIISHVAGRTDHHDMNVPNGAFVVPADVVSGLGEGNSLAGMKVIEHMFPHPRADGGSAGEPVPIAAAGGEVVLSPEQLKAKFGGDLDHAHKTMDHWVVHERKKIVKTMSKLPPPAKD